MPFISRFRRFGRCFISTLAVILSVQLLTGCQSASLPTAATAETTGSLLDSSVTDESVMPYGTESQKIRREQVLKLLPSEQQQLYENRDFGGYSFRILGMESGSWWYSGFSGDDFNEIWFGNDSAEPLCSAVYTRNARTEQLLNLNLSPIWTASAYDTAERIRAAEETSDTAYDLCLTALKEGLLLASEGYCRNICSISSIHTDGAWWDGNLISAYTLLHDRQYLLSGDINIYDDMATEFLMFHPDAVEELTGTSVYDTVNCGAWTVDALASILKTAESNGDTLLKIKKGTSRAWLGDGQAMFSGFGLPYSVVDSDGVPQVMTAEAQYASAAKSLYQSLFAADLTLASSASLETRDARFADKQLLFCTVMAGQLSRYRLNDAIPDDLGVLPFPKQNAEQAEYWCGINSGFFSAYVIPSFVRDAEAVGTTVELMSMLSGEPFSEALISSFFGAGETAHTEENTRMLSLIFLGGSTIFPCLVSETVRRASRSGLGHPFNMTECRKKTIPRHAPI